MSAEDMSNESPASISPEQAQTSFPVLEALILGLLAQHDQILTSHAMAVFDPATGSLSIFLGPRDLDAKSGPLSASKASIAALPRVVVTEEEMRRECAICLEEFEVGCESREMPCKHRFHSGCIEKWLGVRGTCPVCRFSMPVEEQGNEVRPENQRAVWLTLVINSSHGHSSNTESGQDAESRMEYEHY